MQNSNGANDLRPVNATIARVAVVASVLLMLGLMGLMWRQWARVQEPTTAIVVNGDQSLDGTKIAITSLEEGTQSKGANVVLSRDNLFRTAVYRYPGRYHVIITAPWRQSPLWAGDVTLDRLRGVLIDLPTVVTVIGDASMVGDRVTVMSDDGRLTESQTLGKGNNNRARFVLVAAHYTLSVIRDGTVIYSDPLTVESHTAQQVDLRKPQ